MTLINTTGQSYYNYGLQGLTKGGRLQLVKKLLNFLTKKPAPNRRRVFKGLSMRNELETMKKFNNGVISMSGGR
ncbi:MAG: hypothetical protein G01um101416_792 [Microgenomates group bacterium Gr01-1014_16]|nr:MAG: hypothetical protein G01um101416_792 [Microgenomates group bacterium Gr01-1014_16]